MTRVGARESLVLLHGVASTENIWKHVVPLTSRRHDTIAFTLLGHRGGPPASATDGVTQVVDDAERQLDLLGLECPHLAGHSLGGWVALELARRGRAASVCALSPAGCWDVAAGDHQLGADTIRATVRTVKRIRWALPFLARFAAVRHRALVENAAHGERVSARDLVGLADDLLGCGIRDAILSSTEQLALFDPLPCPVTLAWGDLDRVFPPSRNGLRARRLMPSAEWRVLEGVGHAPMLDDPRLVADTILATTARAAAERDQSVGN